MSLWGNKDLANNAPFSAPSQVKFSPTTANQTSLYGNTKTGGFISGANVGTFAADRTEVATNPGIAHAGWQLRIEGSGGRAGRVFYETLVAGRSFGTTDAEDVVLVDALLAFITQPGNKSAANNANAYFFANVSITPSNAANVQYRWQRDQGNGSFINIASSVVFSGQNTPNLIISNVGGIGFANNMSGNVFRLIVEVDSGSPITSANSTLTVV